ncbi:tetratricopeptide repeat protein [Marinomonas gallaica]|uniref:tetratricopeptide repeat protein n=1 Tax=Marinomonas gallaica TaxID=1806667 RepID=UPI0008315298|nr:tetratricopeptide repeat protein [Marinomonas gallaica]
MKNTFAILVVITMGLLSSSSIAQPDSDNTSECIVPSNLSTTLAKSDWKKLHDFLYPQFENCLDRSDYFALYGASLLYLGDTNTAIEMLERALLIDPYNGSAKVDYAQALYQSGELISALQTNGELLQETSIPPALYTALQRRQDQWEQQKNLWRSQFSYLYGHSSNLNNATYIENYEQTYQGYNIIRPILGSSRPQSGGYHNFRFTAQYFTLLAEGISLLTISSQSRKSKIDSVDTDAFSMYYGKNIEGRTLNHRWQIGLEHVRLGDEGLYSSFEGNYTLTPRDSVSHVKFELGHTHFNGDHSLDDISFSIKPGVTYSIGTHQLGAEISLGLNASLEERAGGNRTIKKAAIFYDLPVLNGRLMSKFSVTATRDREGFSPALANNETRNTDYWSAELQYIYPISENFTIQSSYYYRDQDSNIEIFKTKNESIDFGFNYRF